MTDKEFFEAFGIKYELVILPEAIIDKNNGDFPRSKQYPPITAEIREKLEGVLLSKYSGISYSSYGLKDKVYLKIEDEPYCASGKTRQDALLNLCIQLKSEIYNEVREVFNDR